MRSAITTIFKDVCNKKLLLFADDPYNMALRTNFTLFPIRAS
jgi:hypothetical protein